MPMISTVYIDLSAGGVPTDYYRYGGLLRRLLLAAASLRDYSR